MHKSHSSLIDLCVAQHVLWPCASHARTGSAGELCVVLDTCTLCIEKCDGKCNRSEALRREVTAHSHCGISIGNGISLITVLRHVSVRVSSVRVRTVRVSGRF